MKTQQRPKRKPVSPAVAFGIIAFAVIAAFAAIWFGTRGPDSRTAAKTEGFKKVQSDLYKELKAHPEQMRRGGTGMPGIRRGPDGMRMPGRGG